MQMTAVALLRKVGNLWCNLFYHPLLRACGGTDFGSITNNINKKIMFTFIYEIIDVPLCYNVSDHV